MNEEQLKDLLDQAKAILYGENFEQMMNLFKKNGRPGFADAMAIVVVGVLDRLEQDNGELDPQILLIVAFGMVGIIATDVQRTGLVPDIETDDVQLALGNVVAKWMNAHEGRAGMEQGIKSLQKEAMARRGQGQSPEQGLLAQQAANSGFTGGM